jgi:hypothetical protein
LSFDKLTIYTKLIADLADKPNMSGADLKAYFDSSPEEIRVAFNALIDGLKSTTSGDSGAKNIGVTSISGLTGNDIQALLGALKTLVDTKTDKSGDHPGTWQGFNATQVDATVGGRLDALEAEHSDQNVQTVVIPHGLSIIETDQKTPLDIAMDGRTISNGLGKLGNPEATGKGTLANITEAVDSNNYVVGTNSIKITASGTTSVEHYYALKNYSGSINWDVKASTNYLIGVYLKPNVGKVKLRAILKDSADALLSDTSSVHISDTTKFTYTKLKIDTGTSGAKVEIRIQLLDSANAGVFIASATAENANFDAISLYELSTTQSNEIDILTSDEVAEKYGYVDSVKHIQNPVFVSYGKNLLPPFTEWTLHANATVIEPYKLDVVANGTAIVNEVDVPALPDTTYTISGTKSAYASIYYDVLGLDANGTQVFDSANSDGNNTPVTFTTPSAVRTLRFRAVIMSTLTSGTYNFSVPQLELGSTATTFEIQNKTYLYGKDVKIGEIGGVKDQLLDRKTKLKKTELDVVLDGSLSSVGVLDRIGYKRIALYIGTTDLPNYTSHNLVKYDGKILKPILTTSDTEADQSFIHDDNGKDAIFITVSDTDSGWTDAMTGTTITSDFIRGLANGWKYTGDGTTHSWAQILDATVTSTSATFVADRANKHADWKGFWSLDYQLADEVVEPVTMEGALNLIEGLNTIEMIEGYIVREVANPKQDSVSKEWYINDVEDGDVPSGSELDFAPKEIIEIYKNGDPDNNWTVFDSSIVRKQKIARISDALFDSTAQYTVTYLVLDKHLFTANALEAEGTYNTNLKTVVDKHTDQIADINTKQSQQDIWNIDVGVTGNKLKVQVGNASANQAVTFKQAFSSPPTMYPSNVTAKTATGFTMNASGGDWIAIGNK